MPALPSPSGTQLWWSCDSSCSIQICRQGHWGSIAFIASKMMNRLWVGPHANIPIGYSICIPTTETCVIKSQVYILKIDLKRAEVWAKVIDVIGNRTAELSLLNCPARTVEDALNKFMIDFRFDKINVKTSCVDADVSWVDFFISNWWCSVGNVACRNFDSGADLLVTLRPLVHVNVRKLLVQRLKDREIKEISSSRNCRARLFDSQRKYIMFHFLLELASHVETMTIGQVSKSGIQMDSNYFLGWHDFQWEPTIIEMLSRKLRYVHLTNWYYRA